MKKQDELGLYPFITSVPSHHHFFESIKPRKKAFDLPPSFVPTQAASILCRCILMVFTVRRDESDSLAIKDSVKRFAVIGSIPVNPSGSSHCDDLIDGSLDESDFMRLSWIRVQGDR